MVAIKDTIIIGTDDILNKNKERNIKNSNKWDYNCAGYALGTFSWYCPYEKDTRSFFDFIIPPRLTEEEMEKRTKNYIEQMLNDFDDLRIIDNLRELRFNEYAIAFRVSPDDDFHYVKRTRGGLWYHKRGNTPFIERMKKSEVFSDCWCERYTGRLVLFAKKY